jgi:UDP-3-O-[3-hydroxymyristoyl] N-acetylglucosamine deacetylase
MFDVSVKSENAADSLSIERVRPGHPQSARPPSIRQHTLRNAISCSGVGLHSGSNTTLTLRPAEADKGIVFRRVDARGKGALIPALWSNVTDTRLNTCISNADGISVRTIEHLMSALAGLGVDNAVIEIDGEEVPVMDGSAAPFVFLIECAGLVEQAAPRQVIKLLKPVVVRDGDKVAVLRPDNDFTLSMEIEFAAAAIGRQQMSLSVDCDSFKAEVSRARTFGFEQEVEAMRAAGLGRGGSLENAVVIAGDGSSVLNEEGLRYDDEFVRHKLLDALGDLALAGSRLQAHFVGVRTGHALNNSLLRALFADGTAWVRVPQGVQGAAGLPRRLVAAPSM